MVPARLTIEQRRPSMTDFSRPFPVAGGILFAMSVVGIFLNRKNLIVC